MAMAFRSIRALGILMVDRANSEASSMPPEPKIETTPLVKGGLGL
jgi:hypothetical protein